MSKSFKTILFTLIAFMAMIACSEDVKPTPYKYTRIFTGKNNKTWKVKLIEETLNGRVINRFLPTCTADDRYVFYANAERAFEAVTGSRKCSADPEPDIISDSWSFNNASATLNMVLPFLAEISLPYIVREADEEDMKVEIFFDQTNTGSYRIQFEAVDEE